tara:strand:+ start:330 stop:539 length:210 start_codon:yes stop_codon:yes gene_type:complete
MEVEQGPGIVVIEGTEIGYVKQQDIAPAAFKEKLLQLIGEDNHQHIFVVHKDNLNLHVSKIMRPPVQLT